MTITRVELDNFLVFKNLSIDLCPGINVIIGGNGTGKTTLLKFVKCAYETCVYDEEDTTFIHNIHRELAAPACSASSFGHRPADTSEFQAKAFSDDKCLSVSFRDGQVTSSGEEEWKKNGIKMAYMIRDVLCNYGFHTLPIDEPTNERTAHILCLLDKAAGGMFKFDENDGLQLRSNRYTRDFFHLSSGQQKLARLWMLVRNGIPKGLSVLILDDAEQNLSPNILDNVAQALIELQRLGVQIFLSTYSYILMKELELGKTENDSLLFHSLYRGDDGEVHVQSCPDRRALVEDVTQEAGVKVYDKELDRLLS